MKITLQCPSSLSFSASLCVSLVIHISLQFTAPLISPPLIGFHSVILALSLAFPPHAVSFFLSFIQHIPLPFILFSSSLFSLSLTLFGAPPSPFCSVAVHFLAWHDTLENSSTILSPSERDARQPVPPVSSLSPSLLFFQLKFSFSSSVTQMTFPNPSSLPCTHSCRHAHVYRHQRENVCVFLTGQRKLTCQRGA